MCSIIISLDGVDYNHTHVVIEFLEGINLAQFSIVILENPACTDDGNHQFLIDLVETRNIFIPNPNRLINISLLNIPPCKFLCMYVQYVYTCMRVNYKLISSRGSDYYVGMMPIQNGVLYIGYRGGAPKRAKSKAKSL